MDDYKINPIAPLARSIRAVVIVALLVMAACAGKHSGLIATGETLDVIGQQFISAARIYDTMHATGRIADAEYVVWADFARKFQPNYNRAVELWNTWEQSKDAATAAEVAQLVNDLKSQILYYYLEASRMGGA